MVRFVAGMPRKGDYRKFRIKTVEDIDDYSMIREVVRRRYSRLIQDDKVLPDLVLIDGGKGHLSVARRELDGLGLKKITVVSIAKEYNHLYTARRRQPIRLSPGSRLLLLVQRVRDEAHRFAIAYHRKMRDAKTMEGGLREIKGIGPAREKMLLDKFEGMGAIRAATVKELCEAGIDEKTAREVTRHFGGKK